MTLHDQELERRVLGTIMGFGLLHAAEEILNRECFADERNLQVFDAMKRLDEKKKKISLITVDYEIKCTVGYVAVGGKVYLTETYGLGDLPYNLQTNCKILFEYYMRRKLLEIGNYLQDAAVKSDPFVLRDSAELLLSSLMTIGGDTTTSAEIQTSLDELFKSIVEFGHSGIQTGIREFDMHTGGLQPQELVVIGSWQSNGKTALATNIMYNAGISGIRGKYYSFEQPPTQIVLRQAGMITGYTSKRILMNKLFETNEVKQAIKDVLALPTLYGEKNTHINDLISDIRYSVKRLGVKFVVIDHLQFLTFDEKDVRIGISKCANNLKRLANELNIPIVLLSQMARPEAGGATRGPKMKSLKESGTIEQAADVVWIPWIPYNEPSEMKEVSLGISTLDTIKDGYKLMIHTIAKGKNCGVGKWHGYFADTTKLISKDYIDTGFYFQNTDNETPF